MGIFCRLWAYFVYRMDVGGGAEHCGHERPLILTSCNKISVYIFKVRLGFAHFWAEHCGICCFSLRNCELCHLYFDSY